MKQVVLVPQIILPNKNVEMDKWAVIACDQFSSQAEYWENVKQFVGANASMLNIVLPEVFLSEDNSKKIDEINKSISLYNEQVFDTVGDCFVLTVRQLHDGTLRKGLVVSVDLEEYSYNFGDDKLIKATEETVLERIPPRVQIRKTAEIESPHIMLLIDDVNNEVIQPIYDQRENLECLYDFTLNMNGGHIQGYKVSQTDDVLRCFNKLLDPALLQAKYQTNKQILFAVGDGNHSLATAKQHWDNLKQGLEDNEQLNHPARFALVEVVNIYDDGVKFDSIHRAVFNVDEKDFISQLKKHCKGDFNARIYSSHGETTIRLGSDVVDAINDVAEFVEKYKLTHQGVSVDYIHDIEHLKEVASKQRCVGIQMPVLQKNQLFRYVLTQGVYPCKSFSIGQSIDKRYYLECRRIK